MKTKLNRGVVSEKSRQTIMEREVEGMYTEMYPTIKKLMRRYKVNVSKRQFLQIALYSYMHDIVVNVEEETGKQNIISRLEKAMIFANNDGKKELSEINITRVFDKEIKNFKEVRELNKEYIKAVAYHEVGHFILNEEMGESEGKVINVSIIAFLENDFDGVNITSEEIGKEYKIYTLENTIKTVAMNLAGDISCEIFLGNKDEGILEDYEVATRKIHAILLGTRIRTKGKYLGNRGSYIINGNINYTVLTERQREELAKQTSKIMEKSEKLAKKDIKRKRKQAKILVEALMERGALTGEQARQLYYGKIKLSDLPPAKINYIN